MTMKTPQFMGIRFYCGRGLAWSIFASKSLCPSMTLRHEWRTFSICSLWRGHRYGVQGGIAGGWIERRGVSRSLRLGGTVGSAALAGRLRLPRLRPSRALRAGGPGALPVQPLQEPDIAHGGHDLPCDQAAAEALVRGHPPDRDGEERRLFGGTRPPPRGHGP